MEKFGYAQSQKFDTYASRLMPRKEFFTSGHRSCQGCGEALAVRWVCKAIGEDAIIAHATGCMEIVSSGMPQTAWMNPWIHVAFENTSAVASGIEAALKVLSRKGKLKGKMPAVVAMGGDGGTSDIGLQSLSGAMERGHNFTYICWDNEAYMNTGIQRSSSTPYGAMTTTSPPGKMSIGQSTQKKNMVSIAVAHAHSLCGYGQPQLPLRPLLQGAQGHRDAGPGLYPRALGLPHRLALRHRPERPHGAPGGGDRGLSPL